MNKLREMIEQELEEKNSSKLNPFEMHQAANGVGYRKLSELYFEPTVGTIGDFSAHEKKVMKNIVLIGKEDDPSDPNLDPELSRAYKTIYGMMPGNVARLRVKENDFYVAAFPTNNLVSPLVLFVNSHDSSHRPSATRRAISSVGRKLSRMYGLLY
jgi:hypothetical protein